jgi:murein DD-endopeptidase MepM/ murein hydrolase activator NlpD
VHASERGVVTFIGTEPRGYGKYVVIRHDGGYASYYAHLSAFEPTLRTGARVMRGQRVGAVGSTGTATGPHLHFEVRRHARLVDPIELVQAARAAKLKGAQRARGVQPRGA